MKRKLLASIILIAVLVCSLVSCGGKYKPVSSTDEELTQIMQIKTEDSEYTVRYELYRALFLTYKSEIDGGDASVWSGENKDFYIEKINGIILSRIAEIYSVFSIAKEIGIDVYSKKYDDAVKEYVKVGVEGGIYNSVIYSGFGGDYEKYLQSLSEMNLNYSTSDLLFRYTMALDEIYYYYGGNVENDAFMGNLSYTKEDVEDFYFGNGSRRVMSLFLSTSTASFTKDRAEQIRFLVSLSKNADEALYAMINYSTLGEGDLKDGIMIGQHSLDPLYYSELSEAALSLAPGETSEVIEIATGSNNGFFILFCMEKSEEHFNNSYAAIADAYVENEIGKILFERAEAIKAAVEYKDAFSALDYAEIKMP